MSMQKSLGELTQAVKTLTDQIKDQGTKLDATCRDIHAAKVVIKVLLGLGVAVATVIGFVAKAAIDYFPRIPVK